MIAVLALTNIWIVFMNKYFSLSVLATIGLLGLGGSFPNAPKVVPINGDWRSCNVGEGSISLEQDTSDTILKRWMANYLAIVDFECDFKEYVVTQSAEDLANLLLGNPKKDSRGYYLVNECHIKFRPRDRLYFLNGFAQTAGRGGRLAPMLLAHDGNDHRTFVETEFSGVIRPEEPVDVRLRSNPNHYVSLDVDLKPGFLAGEFEQVAELVYQATVHIGTGPVTMPKLAKFYLSPDHGYMPRKIEAFDMNGRLEIQFDIEEFQRTNGVWFPIRGKRTLHRDGSVNVLEVDPDSLKINQGLKPNDFSFNYPPGSAYQNIATGETVLGEEWQNRKRQAVAAAQPKFEPPRTGRWLWIIGVCVAMALSGLLLFRKFASAGVIILSVPFMGCGQAGTSSFGIGAEVEPKAIASLLVADQLTKTTIVSAEDSGDYDQEFLILNNSPTTVQITDLVSSCGCMSATLDSHTIPPNSQTKLRLTAKLERSIKDEAHAAHIEVTNEVEKQTLSVMWSIERRSNWRPLLSVVHLNTMAGKSETVGPFSFEVSEDISDPSVRVEDEHSLFQLAGDIRTIGDRETRQRIEFYLATNPTAVISDRRYPLRIHLASGEPEYFTIFCNLQINPKAYFSEPVVLVGKPEIELVLMSIEKPSALSWVLDPPIYNLAWQWDEKNEVVKLSLTELSPSSPGDVAELTLNVKVQNEDLNPTCTLVFVPPSSSDVDAGN